MIVIKRYSVEYKEKWDAFVETAKNGTFMLKRDYMDYHSDRFEDHSLLFYRDDELIALLPASLHGDELRSHGGLTYGGMICGYDMKQHIMDDCIAALVDYMKSNAINTLIYKPMPYIYHHYPCEEDLYSLWRNGAKLVRRDVSTTIEFVENPIKLPKGRKAQISRAKREGIMVCQSDDFETFIALENKVLSQYHQTKAVHTAAELRLLHSRFPEQIKLFVSMHENEMVAGILLFIYDNMVHTQYMASSEFGRENGALDLLIATIIDEYKQQKRYLDFGISTEDAGKILNAGLISQKEGFGGRSVVYDMYELPVAADGQPTVSRQSEQLLV